LTDCARGADDTDRERCRLVHKKSLGVV
jgi:hypothetical protein